MTRRLALAALVLFGCSGDDGGDNNPMADAAVQPDASMAKVVTVDCPASPAATVTTSNLTDAYHPMMTTISVNAIVKFEMSSSHDVAPNPIAANTDSGLRVGFGQTRCLQFKEAGTYGFMCTPHGFVGTVTVQ
jgi:plastocyanin